MIEIEVLSDEEFYEMRERQEKEKFLDSLMGASKSSKKMGFTVKSLRSSKKDNNEVEEVDTEDKSVEQDSTFRRKDYKSGRFDDDEWYALLDRFDQMEPSPIDNVTDYEIESFFGKNALESLGTVSSKEDDPSTRYDNMYKKELAMYSEILKDVNVQTRSVASKLKSMSDKKSSYGVSKYYSELIEQYNSLNNTKMNLVKNMADLKTKIEDFRLKRLKAEGDTGEQTVDELVDQYYKRIMNGGRAEFMSKSLMSQSPYDSDREMYDNILSDGYQTDSGQAPRASFNITQPIPEEYTEEPTESYSTDVDKYNYIKNEYRQPEICVQRWEDGSLGFIALDKDGLEVEDYALPGEDLLETLDIKPMSNFAYDKYGRKYSVIDISTSGVDLDDIDDDDYTYG